MKFDRILIDASYWCRKFFAVHRELLSRIDGQIVRTGIVHGFLLGLANLKDEYRGQVIVCWDAGHDRRRKIDSTYKAERREKKEDWEDANLYRDHMKVLKYFLRLSGVCQARSPGDEGDDVLYTLAKQTEGKALIVTNDHDLFQALGNGTYQLLSKKDGEILYSAKRLERDTGLTPKQFAQAMAIAGCQGDGVPGIPGVGIKTATEWVQRWPQLVPALLGKDDTPLSDWLPETNSKNIVTKATQFFPEGEKGPGKKLKTALEEPWVVHKTEQLTRLYEVHPIKFTRNRYDEDEFVLQLERAELVEVETRLGTLRELHE